MPGQSGDGNRCALATNTFGKLVVAAGAGGFRFAAALAACLLPAVVVVARALVLR